MLFEVGETVVYPRHRAATITEVKTRIVRAEEKLYLKRAVVQSGLVIEVPAENVGRQVLVSELALAEKTDEEKASTVLDEVLAS
ncbi:MAG: hypothetical protein V4531_10730 [Actinomycetota bacterium]